MNNQGVMISEIRVDDELPKYAYYSSIPSIKALEKNGLKFSSNVTFLVGENGSGKSTILEALAIAAGFNPEGGTKNYSFSTNDSHSDLYEHITLVKRRHNKAGYFLRAESFYNVATKEEDIANSGWDPYIPKEYHKKSHGEAFLALAKDFPKNGLYLLDEPEAALSPSRLMSLMCIIKELEDSSQFIISTHSPILMSYPGAKIYKLDEKGIEETDYKSTEHYTITKQFMENADKMFKMLFDE